MLYSWTCPTPPSQIHYGEMPGWIFLPISQSSRLHFASNPESTDNAQALSSGLIALGRLDMKGKWPDYIPLAAVAPEVKAYEAAYRTICEQSTAGRLDTKAVARSTSQ